MLLNIFHMHMVLQLYVLIYVELNFLVDEMLDHIYHIQMDKAQPVCGYSDRRLLTHLAIRWVPSMGMALPGTGNTTIA